MITIFKKNVRYFKWIKSQKPSATEWLFKVKLKILLLNFLDQKKITSFCRYYLSESFTAFVCFLYKCTVAIIKASAAKKTTQVSIGQGPSSISPSVPQVGVPICANNVTALKRNNIVKRNFLFILAIISTKLQLYKCTFTG